MALLRKRRAIVDALRKAFAVENKNRFFIPDKEEEFFAHLNDIFPRDLLLQPPEIRFADLDRQLQSLSVRLERFCTNPAKDGLKAEPLIGHLGNLQQLLAKKDALSVEGLAEVRRYRAMINEYRIVLFSPELKPRETISAKKLEAQWRTALARC